ncbi:MAG: MGMT family protein [Candidatus Hadarchaeales archaeon]
MKFTGEVLKLVSRVPRGRITTYGEIARALGRPKAARAVGLALSKNPFPGRIPCHRVIRRDGGLGGYSLGIKLKERMLREEGIEIRNGRIQVERYFFRIA